MEAVAILFVLVSPGLAAIVGRTYIKAKQLQLQSGDGDGVGARLRLLEHENKELRRRVETLETIVTDDSSLAALRQREMLPAPEVQGVSLPSEALARRR